LRNTPEERISQLHCDGSLQAHNPVTVYQQTRPDLPDDINQPFIAAVRF